MLKIPTNQLLPLATLFTLHLHALVVIGDVSMHCVGLVLPRHSALPRKDGISVFSKCTLAT